MSRLGLVLHHGIDSGPELADYGRIAQEAGYESLWVTERYFHEETASLLGYLAASTTTLRLGVGVVNPYTRHPALTAMAAAPLDRLSGGRFMLGLGRSDRDVIEDRMGMPYGSGLAVTCLRSDARALLEPEPAGLKPCLLKHLGPGPRQPEPRPRL